MPKNKNALYAIAKLVTRQARELAQKEDTQANDVIDFVPQLSPWREKEYTAGEVVVYNGVPYRCVTAHSSIGNEMWNPVNAPSLWANYHGTDMEHALPYCAPTGAHDAYRSGEWMIWDDGFLYLCKGDSVVHSPDILPSAWEKHDGGDEQ